MLLKGKVAIVTGSSRNIGASMCESLAKEGAKVVVNYPFVSEEENAFDFVNKIKAAGGESIAIMASVDKKEEVDNLIAGALKQYGKLDVMVNNAGICPMLPWFETTEEVWDRVMNVNLKGCYFCTQAASKVMVKQGHGGVIISTASMCANRGAELLSAYCASKAGVKSLMQCAALSLGKYNIRCNSILPGTILTDINREQYKTDIKLREYKEWLSPLGRLGEPDDVAGAVVFLASDMAKYLTGIEILVDGGMGCHWD